MLSGDMDRSFVQGDGGKGTAKLVDLNETTISRGPTSNSIAQQTQ